MPCHWNAILHGILLMAATGVIACGMFGCHTSLSFECALTQDRVDAVSLLATEMMTELAKWDPIAKSSDLMSVKFRKRSQALDLHSPVSKRN